MAQRRSHGEYRAAKSVIMYSSLARLSRVGHLVVMSR